MMKKSEAIAVLGGTIASVAEAVGCSYQAVGKWPAVLPRRIADRVVAAYAYRCLRDGGRESFWIFLANLAESAEQQAPAAIKAEANGGLNG